MATKPRSFVEFYKVVTKGHRDAHAFLDRKIDPLGFSETAARLRRRLRTSNKFLLNPSSRPMQYWDLYMLTLLVYTATVTPYEICMIWETTTLNALYVVNWIVNLSFFIDIIVNFVLPYRLSAKKGGALIKNHRRIARHYLLGWFLVDIISCVPVDTILMNVDMPTEDDQQYVEMLRVVRLMRLARLLKLLRILRASRIFRRWENAITFSYSQRELIRYITIVVVVLHWLACALGLLAQLTPTQRTAGLQASLQARIASGYVDSLGDECYGCVPGDPINGKWCETLCLTPCEMDLLAREQLGADPHMHELGHMQTLVHKQETWICRFNAIGVIKTNEHHGEVWVAAVYVALVQLSGGVGSIYPENLPEYVVFIFGILMGSVIWAMVVGTICAMMSTGDPHTIEYHQQLDQLNSFLKDTEVPIEIGTQARAYLHSTRDLRKKHSYDELMMRLSPGLRGEIMLYLSKSTFGNVWYLSAIEPECLVQLAARLTRHGFPPRERMPSVELMILSRGIAARGGELLYSGMCWGSDIILSSRVLRDTRLITALTYVELQALSRESLYSVLDNYPESARVVQNAAVRMALKRTVVLLKAYADSQRLPGVGGAHDGEPASKKGSTSAAYSMLTAAFSDGAGPTSSGARDRGLDLGSIFRIITGSKLRDVDADGNLLERVEDSDVQQKRQGDAEERRAMRHDIEVLRDDVAGMRTSMHAMEQMLKRMSGAT